MENFCKDFFNLQLAFAKIISEKQSLPLQEVLLKYTFFYVRFLGFSDQHPPTEKNPKWKKIIAEMPADQKEQEDYFYNLYLTYEKNKSVSHSENTFGCFAYVFHPDLQKYELHFDAVDPKGNLAKDRIDARRKELEEMFEALQQEEIQNATFFVQTWLLNIEAFTRLFPKEFIATAKKLKTNLAQNNAHWGQFIDRHGNIKSDLADQLLATAREKSFDEINDYFPLPTLRAEIALHYFYPFQILEAAEVTVEAYRDLRLEALKEEPQAFGSSYSDQKERSNDEWQQYLNGYIDGKKSWMVFARDGEKLIGMLGAFRTENDADKTAQIIAVYVTKAARGKGVGKLLMQSLLDKLSKETDIKKLTLAVNIEQTTALKLYESFGFEITGKEQMVLGDGKSHEEYLMERAIS